MLALSVFIAACGFALNRAKPQVAIHLRGFEPNIRDTRSLMTSIT
jgi:hypothetical protein